MSRISGRIERHDMPRLSTPRAVLGVLDALLHQWRGELCYLCGCLCRSDEVCPNCRAVSDV